jgi:tetratricopeptide (TPR) repeat protein
MARKRAAAAGKPAFAWFPAWEKLQKLDWLWVTGLAFILTFALYWPALFGEFTNWDDNKLVLENESVLSLSPANVVDIFVPKGGQTYQPLRVLSYALNYAVHGERPFGYHLINLLLHVAATVALYLFICALLERRRGPHHGNRCAALVVAMLFLLHPVNVEAVAWISSRKYGLLAAFLFLSLYLYQKAQLGSKSAYAGSWGAAWIAILSSPFGVTIPPLIVLTDLYVDGVSNLAKLARRLPIYLGFAVIAVVILPLLMNVRKSDEVAEIAKPHYENRTTTFYSTVNGIGGYTKNLVAPVGLNCRYPNEIVHGPTGTVLLVLFAIVGLSAGAVWSLLRGERLGFLCFGWVVVTWGPVAQIVPISTIVADRYLYLTGVGAFLFLALAAEFAFERKRSLGNGLVGGFAVLAVVCAVLTHQRAAVWRSSVALWADSVAKSPHNYLARNSYGQALRKVDQVDEAEHQFREAIKTYQQYARAHHSLGDILLNERNQPEVALPHFQVYLDDLDARKVPLAQRNALAYMNVGIIYGRRGDMAQASAFFETAFEIDPTNSEVNHNIGVMHTMKGQYEEAAQSYEVAVSGEPKSAQVFLDYHLVLTKLGRTEAATEVARRGHELFPDSKALTPAHKK